MVDGQIKRDGGVLRYDITGPPRGRTVVVAHGLGSSRRNEGENDLFDWSALTAEGIRLVRYDARGHGRSTGGTDPNAYTWPLLAEDLLSVIARVSAGRPADVIGTSMGAATALWAATYAPQQFRRLVLVTAPTAWATRTAQAETYATRADDIERRGLEAHLTDVDKLPPQQIWPNVTTRPPSRPDVVESLLPAVLRGAAASDLPPVKELRAIRHRTLLLSCPGDSAHPLATSYRLASLLPNASIRVAHHEARVRSWGSELVHFLRA